NPPSRTPTHRNRVVILQTGEETMTMRNRAVLVTGGSRGLGAAFGTLAALEGAKVVFVARGTAELEATVEAIRARGGRAFGIVADVGERGAATRIAAE